MKIMLRTAIAAVSFASIGPAIASEGDGPAANTFFTQLPGPRAQATAQNAPAVATAQNGQPIEVYATQSSRVRAETLYPIQGKTIDLGTIGGIVYYTIQPDGYRVVATLGTESPVRFIATLSPEQSIFLSTPRGLGQPAMLVRIMRHGEQLLVDGGTNSPGE
jgi:hypothetical protein